MTSTTFSIRALILAWLVPEHRLRCRARRWSRIVDELARRSANHRESGAFLLGYCWADRREIVQAIYYDDLAPEALRSGAILFPGSAYGLLWRICRERALQVVADVHTHPGRAIQSHVDREHPMIAEKGHVAIILPRFAQRPFLESELGVYEYLGGHRWTERSQHRSSRFFIRPRL